MGTLLIPYLPYRVGNGTHYNYLKGDSVMTSSILTITAIVLAVMVIRKLYVRLATEAQYDTDTVYRDADVHISVAPFKHVLTVVYYIIVCIETVAYYGPTAWVVYWLPVGIRGLYRKLSHKGQRKQGQQQNPGKRNGKVFPLPDMARQLIADEVLNKRGTFKKNDVQIDLYVGGSAQRPIYYVHIPTGSNKGWHKLDVLAFPNNQVMQSRNNHYQEEYNGYQ